MLFIITNHLFQSSCTGEHQIICLVEGDVSPDHLLEQYANRQRLEQERNSNFLSAFPEKPPVRPKKPFWKFWVTQSGWNDYISPQWSRDYQDFHNKYILYANSYQPEDVLPEVSEFLVSHGYKLIGFQVPNCPMGSAGRYEY